MLRGVFPAPNLTLLTDRMLRQRSSWIPKAFPRDTDFQVSEEFPCILHCIKRPKMSPRLPDVEITPPRHSTPRTAPHLTPPYAPRGGRCTSGPTPARWRGHGVPKTRFCVARRSAKRHRSGARKSDALKRFAPSPADCPAAVDFAIHDKLSLPSRQNRSARRTS